MWMVGGYNEASHHQYHHHHHQVSLDGRKLRPLIPRPPPAAPLAAACASSATTHSCTAAAGGEQGISNKNIMINTNNNFKEEVNNINGGQQAGVMSTSRWNPTAEQLRTLEDLYRRGTRTPSTDQIQRITAQLRRYGKIEGKNVFYWFQNHKARERQKRRRELQLLSSHHPHMHPHPHQADADDPLLGIGIGIGIASNETTRGPANGKQGFDAEHTRSHYASAAAEECGVMSMPRGAAEKAVSEHRSSSRSTTALNFNNVGSSAVACLFQLDDERNATWHNLAPSSSFCYSSPNSLHSRITTTSTLHTCTDSAPDGATFKTRRFVASLRAPVPETTSRGGEDGEDSATLQLFPLRSQVDGQQEEEEDPDKSNRGDVHFFQFLPPKNN